MIAIPAIDIMDGKCVQLVEGKPWSAKITIDNPVAVAKKWQSMGARRLHVIDLDAALSSGDNEKIIFEILREIEIPTQVGGGIRDDSKAERMLRAGAAQIIVGTRAVTDIAWLKSIACRFPEQIIVAIDARGDDISIKGWTEQSGVRLISYVESIDDLPVFGVLYTNIGKEGKLAGIEVEPIQRIAKTTKKKLFVAGGISSMEDLDLISSTGAYGAVLGMAIYKGKINMKDVLERFG
ncbi:MAG: 1-(5-phosphoribosyl)-5-[(5-phosphoribosylamino)methylideneamino]imidazole-4-carboxamide isomerase [Thermoplasmata archaeon]